MKSFEIKHQWATLYVETKPGSRVVYIGIENRTPRGDIQAASMYLDIEDAKKLAIFLNPEDTK